MILRIIVSNGILLCLSGNKGWILSNLIKKRMFELKMCS